LSDAISLPPKPIALVVSPLVKPVKPVDIRPVAPIPVPLPDIIVPKARTTAVAPKTVAAMGSSAHVMSRTQNMLARLSANRAAAPVTPSLFGTTSHTDPHHLPVAVLMDTTSALPPVTGLLSSAQAMAFHAHAVTAATAEKRAISPPNAARARSPEINHVERADAAITSILPAAPAPAIAPLAKLAAGLAARGKVDKSAVEQRTSNLLQHLKQMRK